MNRKLHLALFFTFTGIFIIMLTACDKTPSQRSAVEKEHFLTKKMETIKKAEEVNQIIQDAADQQHRNIEEQGG